MTSPPPDDRRARAMELHLAGATYQAIANQLGYASKASAHKIVQEALDQMAMPVRPSEGTSTALARLDAMLVGLWPKARRGDVQAVDRVLKIEERRVALLALASGAEPEGRKETGLSEFEKRLAAREPGTKGQGRAKTS